MLKGRRDDGEDAAAAVHEGLSRRRLGPVPVEPPAIGRTLHLAAQGHRVSLMHPELSGGAQESQGSLWGMGNKSAQPTEF